MRRYHVLRISKTYDEKIPLDNVLRLSFSKIHISSVSIYNPNFQKEVITKKVMNNYQKLLKRLTFYLETDDETGTAYQEALNEIERFRLLIKNKYRAYMLEEQLKEMGKTLSFLQKKAKRKLQMLQHVNIVQQERGRGGK